MKTPRDGFGETVILGRFACKKGKIKQSNSKTDALLAVFIFVHDVQIDIKIMIAFSGRFADLLLTCTIMVLLYIDRYVDGI
ncbi:MAG TPA: hypothetical protein DET40_19685 [Lentisphaeria bacterium]|nr:MAG: hypothetical protein A2X45_11200 [Lentisphaerae bacterium GWF2_50_93]HCE45771.1 hypothetical protein [Lentisphaeria bacterium]